MERGKIIWLNGVSSAGKTTLTRALQDRLTQPYFWISNDTFCDMGPSKFYDEDPNKMYDKAMISMYNTIKLYSDLGNNVIVDHVMLKTDRTLEECINLLYGYPVLFVHVTCPLIELERRERERGDRNIGQAESQLLNLNPQDTYDITVDTYINSTEVCADQIINLIVNPENYKALKILKSQM